MRRYLRVYRTFFVSSFIREMEFRANFFAKLFQNLVWMAFTVIVVLVIYGHTDSVAGWGKGEAFILAATCFLMNSVFFAFFMSVSEIPGMVRLGTLDFVVTKPIDSQFWVSVRRFNFDQVGLLVAGLVMVVLGVSLSGLSPTLGQWVAYGSTCLASLAIFYGFNLMLMTTGVWLVRVDNLWVLGDSVMQVARFPLDIYQPSLQRFFLYVVPLGFLATVPARQLTRDADPGHALLAVAWAIAFLAASRWFWRFAMTRYTSASS
ncbi:MAG: ABC-2 family transporter protein [Fimbriimonadales bacterium]|nr:ABC-2 family transporter protein [Fimbriimonadales bacterium]